MRRTLATLLALTIITAAAVFVLRDPALGPAPFRADGAPGTELPGDGARGGSEELLEQAEATEQREQALAAAILRGQFATGEEARGRAAAGWRGQRIMDPDDDDWEPAVAADPKAPWVYLLSTRYGAGKPCAGNCPTPWIALEVSDDGGQTWSTGRPLCPCKGSGQYDPIIEVVPSTGEVYAIYMNGFNVMFITSDDHGRTWTDPVPTYGSVSWNDKPVMATSTNGRHVYVSWNGPNGGDPWVAQSHDAGATWSQIRLRNNDRYFFAYDAVVLRDGTAVISESSMTYTNGDAISGVVRQHAFISRDQGQTWIVKRVASVRPSQPCADCRADYYVGHSGVSADAQDRLVYTYDGAATDYGPQRVFVVTSTDGGRHWSDPIRLSDPAQHSSSPMVEARGDGDIRLVWMQTTDGGLADRWDALSVRSRDGGLTWSAPVDISDKNSGAAYKHPDGFEEIYGDYGEIAITSTGDTFATWGEAFSYAGPGGVWFNIGR
ncbi:MAG: sialidase family protein [Actinomycetota bacterium]